MPRLVASKGDTVAAESLVWTDFIVTRPGSGAFVADDPTVTGGMVTIPLEGAGLEPMPSLVVPVGTPVTLAADR